jgi:hypothetical protein
MGVAPFEAGERVALAADVVAVLADEHVDTRDGQVHARRQALAPQTAKRDQCRLGRIDRAGRDRPVPEVGQRPHGPIAPRDDVRDPVAIRVAHRDRAACPAKPALRVDPGQRRIPGNVDRAIQQRVHLRLVHAVERHVDRRLLGVEEVPDDFPDDRHLGVVHDGPHFKRTGHQNTSRA